MISGEVTGDFHVLEIRETAIGMRDLVAGCLDRFTRDDPALSGSTIQKWVGDAFRSILDFFMGHDDDQQALQLEAAQSERKHFGEQLKNLATMNDPTRTDSEIGLSLVEQIQSDCNRRRVCDVFLFSDLLDTKVKVSLHHNPDQANMLERSRAESLLKEFAIGSKSTSLRIRVWGFGRDDARPGLELPDQMRAPLRQYWIGFFGALASHFSQGSGCQISDFFPQRFTPGVCQ